MSKHQRSVTNSIITLSFIIGSMIISSCDPVQRMDPTLMPTTTITPIPTPTNPPTPDPIVKQLEDAHQTWISGLSGFAIMEYSTILEQSKDTSIRASVFKALEEIGVQNLRKADLQYKQSGTDENVASGACTIYQLAQYAYIPILNSQDRPTFEQDPFYIDAARVDVGMNKCSVKLHRGNGGYTDILNYLDKYPDKSEIKQVFVSYILDAFEHEFKYDYDIQGIPDNGKLINSKVGEFQINGKKVSDWINTYLSDRDLCTENPKKSLTLGTSKIKKVIDCTGFLSAKIIQAGLFAADPTEIWYILKYETTQVVEINFSFDGNNALLNNYHQGDLHCTGYRTDGPPFSYSYPSQWKETYTLRDVHKGNVLATKTFSSTIPKCVFSRCTVDVASNFANCVGGEPYSTYDESKLIKWLKTVIK